MKSYLVKLLAATALAALAITGAHAQTTYNWATTVDNSLWSDSTSWDQTTVPGSLLNGSAALDDIVNLLNNGPSGAKTTVLNVEAGTVGALNIGGGPANTLLQINGGVSLAVTGDLLLGGTAQGVVNSPNATSVTVGGDLLFGGSGAQGGTYNLSSGTLTVTGDIIEGASGAPNSAVNAAQLHIDSPVPDSLTVNGGNIIVQRLAVAQANGSTASQSFGVAGNFDVTTTGTLAVGVGTDAGSGGIGTLTLGSLGTMTVANANIGENGVSTGTFNIDGSFTSASRVYVAGLSTGNQDDSTTGTINIGATGSMTINSGNLEIGRDGDGFLNINGGTYLQKVNNLVLGQNGTDPDTAEGTVTIGTGSIVQIGDADNGALNSDININHSGGTITQTGGSVTVERNLNLSPAGEPSTYDISGGTLIVGQDIAVRGGGGTDTLRVSGTGDVSCTRDIILNQGTDNALEIVGSTGALFALDELRCGAVTTVRYEFDGSGVFAPQVGILGLNDATLELTGTLPTVGNTTLVDVAGTSPASVVGTFLGIPEGGFFEQGGQNFQITYTGNDGNDVVITAVAGPIVTISADVESVVEGGTAAFTLTRVGPTTGDIDVTLAYGGSASDGSDFTGIANVIIGTGATEAPLDLTTNVDGDLEGCEVITATIIGVSGAMAEVGTPFSAQVALTDANVDPAATNVVQAVVGTGTVDLTDIVVSDPDASYDSNYDTTTSTPLYHFTGQGNASVFNDGRADDDFAFDIDAAGPVLDLQAGFALDLEFTPLAGDVAGTTLVWEIGGSSNGSSLYLVNGIPHLLIKCQGQANDVPTDDGTVTGSFNDLNWDDANTSSDSEDDTVVVPLGTTPLTAGNPARVALTVNIPSGNIDSVTFSVNGSAPATTNLVGTSGNENWRGDHSVAHGQRSGGIGGANNQSGQPFEDTGTREIKNFVNGFSAIGCARFWNETTGSVTGTAGSADTITATLTIGGWSTTSDGALSGLTNDGGGAFSIAGDVATVNAALAATQFVETTATYPVVISVSISDGGGGAPVTGNIVILDALQDPVYVDDDFGTLAIGDPITDADGGSAVAAATFGANAFATFAEAIGVLAPGGTIVANDGTYGEAVVLAGGVTLRVTDSAGPVTIASLGDGATGGNTLQIDAPNTLVTGDDAGNNTFASVITGAGGYTKAGTDIQILTGANTHTGLITVSEGTLRIGDNATTTTALAGTGSIDVSLNALLQLRPAVDRSITVARTISGDGGVATQGDGTTEFTGGPNPFTGGFDLGDGAVSSDDGDGAGAKQGFTVVNTSGDLGTGIIRARGSQLQAAVPGINITNDIEILGGALRMGGDNDIELSGTLSPLAGNRGLGHYGLDDMTVTFSGEIDLFDEAAGVGRQVQFDGSNGKDNGDFIVSGDISGTSGNVILTGSIDNANVTLSGSNTYTGITTLGGGAATRNAFLNGTHTGGGIYTVTSGALAGTGTTDSTVNVNAGGTIAGGASLTTPGILGTGDLNILGTLLVGITDTEGAAGTGYSQLSVTGSVDVSTATLALLEGVGASLDNAVLTIIANDAADAVTPAFTGLPQGAVVPRGTEDFALIGYAGGDGNDVVLDLFDFGDFDADGIPNRYEIVNFGVAAASDPSNAVLDNDGDGVSNLDEYLQGTDPNDPASVFTIAAVTIVTPGAEPVDIVYGPIFGGLSYELSSSPDVDIFTLFDTFDAAVDAADNTVLGVGGLDVEAFRVEVFGNELP